MVAETVKARCIRMGEEISSEYLSEAREILETYGIDGETGIIDNRSCIPESVRTPLLPAPLSDEQITEIVAVCNEDRSGSERIMHTEKVANTEASASGCVYICVDDIGVKHQKEKREKGYLKERKYVENTVIHIQCGEMQQTLTAIGMRKAFLLLVAFLLANGLMEDRRLIFLTDGAKNIREYITAFFGFREYTLILDWLHLKKKCKELLSMAVKGRGKTKQERKEDKGRIVGSLLRILWSGNAPEAIGYLDMLDEGNINSLSWMEQLKDYIARKQEDIACYALRHKLGLRISSNRVEKANDMLVAGRQKHNGMSWSSKGSGALAVIAAIRVNGKLHGWLRGKKKLMDIKEAA